MFYGGTRPRLDGRPVPAGVVVRYRPTHIMILFLIWGSERLTPTQRQVGGMHGYMGAGLADAAPSNPPITHTSYVTACRLGEESETFPKCISV